MPGVLQLPEPFAAAVPATVPSMNTVTVLLGSAVPVMTGADVLTNAPLAGVTTTGAAGATVSTVKEELEAGPVLPTASVARVARVWGPCASGALGVKLQLPEALAVTAPAALPSRRT